MSFSRSFKRCSDMKQDFIYTQEVETLEATTEDDKNLKNRPPLLRLPVEIRVQIYEYLIPRTKVTNHFYPHTGMKEIPKSTDPVVVQLCKWNDINDYSKWQDTDPHRPRRQLEILRTCRSIHFEVLSMMYSRSLFHFIGFNYVPVVEFMRKLSPEARNRIKQVRITLLGRPPEIKQEYHKLFCNYICDELPALGCLTADPWTWVA